MIKHNYCTIIESEEKKKRGQVLNYEKFTIQDLTPFPLYGILARMIKPLQIANRSFPNNIILGPLAGISTTPYRLLAWEYSKPAFSYSEMISASALVRNSRQTQKRYLDRSPNEGPVCFQLVGSIPKELAEATKIVADSGADLIDFNCGCSVPKIHNNGCGSALLKDRVKLYNILNTIRKNTTLPFLVKIRVAINDDKTNEEVAKVITDAGADCVVVHGRNWGETFNTPCRLEAIKFFVGLMKIPVIGNGDVKCIDSLKNMFATGCNGAMISRACVGQPWLIGKLIADINQQSCILPTSQEIGEIFISHIKQLAKLLENERMAVLQARKLAKSYARTIPNRKDFSNQINICDDLPAFTSLCRNYFL
ncbi:MAG: tRNA-dihydrouridine synthase [Gammaproteobacteria bacterium]|nr:tRNA-dihydrouridine synthase [Gammaproteobacteria bacterium]